MFLWIRQLQKQVNKFGSINALIDILKRLSISDVCIKYHEGSKFADEGINFKEAYMSYANDFKNAGFRVGTWGYNYFNNVADEINCIKSAIDNSDYYIYNPEVDVANENSAAEMVCSSIRNRYPDTIIGYSTFPIISYHENIPYLVFNKYCDFASPKCYWGEMKWNVDVCIDRTFKEYRKYNLDKPIYPSIQIYNVVYNDLARYIGYKFSYTGLWNLDDWSSTFVDFLSNKCLEINGQENAFNYYEEY